MSINLKKYKKLLAEFGSDIKLIAVSKTKPAEDIKAMYDLGQKDFGENYVQELVDKYEALPKDIQWHFIGHLQTNKVKYIAPFVSMIQSVDSKKLLAEINKQAKKNNRTIDCLIQVHIAIEESKFGFDEKELSELFENDLSTYANIKICGLMGMASFTYDTKKVRNEFKFLKSLFIKYASFSAPNSAFSILSMGMSSDYEIAVEEGSNMVRIGSLLFGERENKKT